jgi:hypothetical protein
LKLRDEASENHGRRLRRPAKASLAQAKQQQDVWRDAKIR